ncbi:MAG TPA: hypothetical protein DD381_05860 [Lentisphaeria bacterium]|nr:MAG: hypothetical protein A2X47_08250 [Lentisphaerae bacterium GWF2_38_69]HBM15850.1 hypothetical protein [Lentisphaeria bacterium]
MKVLFYAEAVQELRDAASYYKSIYTELGLDFQAEIKTQIHKISENPELSPIRDDMTRRISLARFPYFIIYLLEKDIIWIVAVAHHKRFPDYWKNRI